MPKPDRQTLFLGSVVFAVVIGGVFLGVFYRNGHADRRSRGGLTLRDIPFDGQQAYTYLKQICDLGPRPSGTAAMTRQREMLQRHFTSLGGQVGLQTFTHRHPETGQPIEISNLIVQWHPDRVNRVLVCCHYDTRPFPDRDRKNPRGTFIGANDGASGVALLMELGKHMPTLPGRFGVDFVFFDAEELVYDDDRDKYFLGSEYFAREYIAQPPKHRYHWGILVDMVADETLDVYQEKRSLRHARSLVESIWATAKQLGVREFIARPKYDIRDDHVPLNDIARIPTADIIDFDYPRPRYRKYWHTEADTADKCSALSLAKVGWVVHEWLRQLERAQ